MASRKRCADDIAAEIVDLTEFGVLPEESNQLTELRESRRNTCAHDAAQRVLRDYCAKVKGASPDFMKQMTAHEINDFLRSFYADVRKLDGNPYAKHSMVTLRYGLQMLFQQSHQIDVIKDSAFKSSNIVFHSVLGNVNVNRLVKNSHIILRKDMDTIRSSYLTDCSNPRGLQNTVFLNMMLHFRYSTYGHWNLRDMKKSHFQVKTDVALNRKFVCFTNKAKIEQQLSAETGDTDDSDADIHNDQVRMYEALDHPASCPVASFEKYVAKLDPMCDSFWQRPRKYRPMDHYWYDGVAVGVNTLGYKMRDISTEAGCSLIYSNHCLRVTSRACRLKMGMTGSPCTCSGQHFFPDSERLGAGFHASLPYDGPHEDDPMHDDVDLQNFIKLEPAGHDLLRDYRFHGQQASISVRSDEGESLPDVNYYLSLPNPCGSETHIGIQHTPAASNSQPASSPACLIESPNQTHPVHLVRADADDDPLPEHAVERQPKKAVNNTYFHPDSWKVERAWLDRNHQRKWLLSQDFQNEQTLCLVNECRSVAPAESLLESPSFRKEVSCAQDTSPSSSVGNQGHSGRSRHPVTGSAAGVRSDQNPNELGSRSPAEPRAAKHAPPQSGGGSGATATTITADGEVLQLQKDVLRMQRENLSLERRKMELEIAKLEAEVFRTRGGS